MKNWYEQFGPAGPTPSEPSESVVRAKFRNPKPKKPPKPKPDRNNYVEAVGVVQSYLDRVRVATRRDLIKNLWRYVNSETLDRVLRVLVEIEYLQIVRSGGIELYRIAPSLRKDK